MIKIRHFDYILWDCFGQFVYCIKDDDDQKFFFLNFTNMTNWLTCNEIDIRYLVVNRSNTFVKLHFGIDIYLPMRIITLLNVNYVQDKKSS